MFKAEVLLSSIGKYSVLTTMRITYPRIIHAEMLRHRVFSRNTASSRAIPIHKVIKQVRENPFIPEHWGAAEPGMQANQQVSREARSESEVLWIRAANNACNTAEIMSRDLGLHKQVVNRLLEPWVWVTEIITGSRWSNFFHLRCHEAAEPHCRKIAELMREALHNCPKVALDPGQWHIPYSSDLGDLNLQSRLAIATARIARVSYLRDGDSEADMKDVALHNRLADSGHWSPFEHCAQHDPEANEELGGNFRRGWVQYRKQFANENA